MNGRLIIAGRNVAFDLRGRSASCYEQSSLASLHLHESRNGGAQRELLLSCNAFPEVLASAVLATPPG
jgi:hypothetical protein